jgi:hypothetical protein
VTQLRKKVLEELKLRNYSQATAHAYVASIRRFAEYFHRSPEQLGRELSTRKLKSAPSPLEMFARDGQNRQEPAAS